MHEQHDIYEDECDEYGGLGRLAGDVDFNSGSDDESSGGDEDLIQTQTQVVDYDTLEVLQEERRTSRTEQPPPTSRGRVHACREGQLEIGRSRSAGGVHMFTNPLGMGSRSISIPRSAFRPLSRLAQQSSQSVEDITGGQWHDMGSKKEHLTKTVIL
jgi:hypothetical protein